MRALIVSHGQPSEPEVGEAEITALAEAVSEAAGFEVGGVTLAAKGVLERAVAGLPAGAPLYPMFMADGWFTQSALPKRLGGADVRQMVPFGMDPRLPRLAAQWLAAEVRAQNWALRDVSVFVSGHGSGRSRRPSAVTCDFAARVATQLPLKRVRCGFVEEPPFLVDAAGGMGAKAVSLPFFAAKRGHVLEDLPEALEAVGFEGLRLEPIGLHKAVPGMIAGALSGVIGAVV